MEIVDKQKKKKKNPSKKAIGVNKKWESTRKKEYNKKHYGKHYLHTMTRFLLLRLAEDASRC